MRNTILALIAGLTAVAAAPAGATEPAHFWSIRFGGPSSDALYSLAVVPGSGDVVATGSFFGTVDFGGVTLTSAGAEDAWLARFSNRGDLKWVKQFNDTNADQGRAVAVVADGSIYLLGIFNGSIDLGGGNLTSSGGIDYFLAKFDGNGTHLWSSITEEHRTTRRCVTRCPRLSG